MSPIKTYLYGWSILYDELKEPTINVLKVAGSITLIAIVVLWPVSIIFITDYSTGVEVGIATAAITTWLVFFIAPYLTGTYN